jgi:hypothetical protein
VHSVLDIKRDSISSSGKAFPVDRRWLALRTSPADYDGKAPLHESRERIRHENNGEFGSSAVVRQVP